MVRRTSTALLIAALLAPSLAGCGPGGEGISALREGRAADAVRLLAEAEKAGGDGTPPEIVHARALAALATGDLDAAEAAAERAAARGGARFEALRDFLRGNAAFARCDAAEARAAATPADPDGWDRALRLAESARDRWRTAAMSREDWPAARRNADRARLRADALRARRDAARGRKDPAAPPPAPMPPPPAPPPGPTAPVPPTGAAPAPSPASVARLLEVLAATDREKEAVRRLRQASRGVAGEEDW
jgi:hypothetical protein